MTATLPQVASEHHERLMHHVNQMPEIGDALLTAKTEEVRQDLRDLATFLSGTLLPHVEAHEAAIYPEVERMLQNRHSMAPMRREHDQIRLLVGHIRRLTDELEPGRLTLGRAIALRRVIFQLYALLKIHLAEEVTYIRLVERGVSSDIGEVIAASLAHAGVPEG